MRTLLSLVAWCWWSSVSVTNECLHSTLWLVLHFIGSYNGNKGYDVYVFFLQIICIPMCTGEMGKICELNNFLGTQGLHSWTVASIHRAIRPNPTNPMSYIHEDTFGIMWYINTYPCRWFLNIHIHIYGCMYPIRRGLAQPEETYTKGKSQKTIWCLDGSSQIQDTIQNENISCCNCR